MKKLLVVLLGLALLTVGAAVPQGDSAPTPAIGDTCDAGYVWSNSVSTDSVIVEKTVICPVSTVLTTLHASDGINVSDQHTSTAAEAARYADGELAQQFDLATTRLAAEVETGQKWVTKLREWSNDAQNYYDQWPTLDNGEQNGTQKDSIMREMLRRQGLTWSGLADLLTVLEKGR